MATYKGTGRKGDAAVHGTSLHFRAPEESRCCLMPGPWRRRGAALWSCWSCWSCWQRAPSTAAQTECKGSCSGFFFSFSQKLPDAVASSHPLFTLPFRAFLSKSRPLPMGLRWFAGGNSPHSAAVDHCH